MAGKQKIYAIELKNIGDGLATRDHLGRKITVLSDAVNEPVYFHDYKEKMLGAPVILLECSAAFLDRLKGEFFIEQMHEVDAGLKTERSPTLQRHFENAAPPPAPVHKKGQSGPKP
jgi:hypothetical protein